MAALQYYSTTRETALTGAATAGDTTLYLADGSTFPDPAVPGNGYYTVIVGYGSDREEVCTVTAKPGANIITVIRGEDGSTASTKNAGDVVVHGVSARDWAGLLSLAGGTMTGELFLNDDPVADMEAATKGYVDLEVNEVSMNIDSVASDVATLENRADALGIWQDYVPTLAQGASTDIAKTVNVARYTRIGDLVTATITLSPTEGGTVGAAVTVTLPVPAAGLTSEAIGSGTYYDASGPTTYPVVAVLSGTTKLAMYRTVSTTTYFGADPNIAVGVADTIRVVITYEAA